MTDFPSWDRLSSFQERLSLFAHLDPRNIEAESIKECPAGRLSGRTIALKDNIAVKGVPTTAGLAGRADHIAQRDALVTQKLRAAGARVLPGLNMDAAALGGATDNPDFGRTLNPHDHGRSAGGSSGGSAAAVASGLVDMAVGTDTLGSVRIPASYCGLFGLKPTFGLIGRTGIAPLAPSFDTVGLLCSDPGDLWPLLCCLAGFDPDDTDSHPAPDGWRDQSLLSRLPGVRIGRLTAIDTVSCDAETLAALETACRLLSDAGAEMRTVDVPSWSPAELRKRAFLVTEIEGAQAFADELVNGRLPANVDKLLRYGQDLSADGKTAAYEACDMATQDLWQAWETCDFLVMPTTPQQAFRFEDRVPSNQADFTALANVAGVPALSIPLPTKGLPTAVQLIGPKWSEPQMIGIAVQLHALFKDAQNTNQSVPI